jgi:putative ABC transport system permease protein
MGSLFQDVRYGIRMLANNPGFTLIAVLTLALGIGANTAIFSAVNAILLRPLPYKDSSRLVNVWTSISQFPDFELGDSPADIADIRAGTHAFEQMAAYESETLNLTGGGDPEEISAGRLSAEFMPMLGIRPVIGRRFEAEENLPNRGDVVIVGDALWRRRFGADPEILGKNLTLNQKPYRIVGVMPPSFRLPEKADLWIPLALTDKESHDRGMRNTFVLAKLKAGAGLPQAQAELNTIAARLAKQYPDDDNGMGLSAAPLQEQTVSGVRPVLLVLLGAVGFVLLIACANVGSLALARGLKRQKEIGIRAALGASRFRIVRLLLIESMLVAGMGGVMGLLFAWWGIDAFRSWAPSSTPRLVELHADHGVLWLTLAISTAAGILFGSFPAIQFSRPNLDAALNERSSAGSDGFRRSRLRNALVVVELALALVLLVGSALTIQSFERLTHVNTGFRTDHLLTMSVHLSLLKYPETSQQIDFLTQALEKLRPLAGVESVAAADTPMLRHMMQVSTPQIEGVPQTTLASSGSVEFKAVTPGFLQTLGMHLLRGRDFAKTDIKGSLQVAIINEAMVRRYWPDRNAIGKRLSFGTDKSGKPIWVEIVGIVNDTRDTSLNATPEPQIFQPLWQHPTDGIDFYLRTSQDPASLAPAAQSQIWALDHDQPVANLSTMDVAISEDVAEPRFRTLLLGLFAGLGLALSLIGIYGVISYSVSQRTHEIGIRMALGAQPRDVMRNVLWDGLKLTLAGLAIGLIAAFALTRLMMSLLFEVKPTDPVTFVGVTILLGAVSLAACYFPARRAMRVDPMVALRYE